MRSLLPEEIPNAASSWPAGRHRGQHVRRVFPAVFFSAIVSLRRPVSMLASLYVNFCLKTVPDARKGFPVFRAALVQPGDAPPCDGRSGFSGLIEITRPAITPG